MEISLEDYVNEDCASISTHTPHPSPYPFTSCNFITRTYSVTYDGNGFNAGEVFKDKNSHENGEVVAVQQKVNLQREGYTFI